MRIGSLFSGVGGLELGLERAGVGTTVFQVELNPMCRQILVKHWPDVPRFENVCDVGARVLPACDVMCGGFPCPDLSDAGSGWVRPGLRGKRSGLWWEYERLIEECSPRWVVVENVDGAAWRRWVPFVRRALWRHGYTSVPIRVRACDVGAPQKGSRVFVAATAHRQSQPACAKYAQVAWVQKFADASRQDWRKPSARAVGMADGIPRRMDRLRAIGNAVVPAAAQVVGLFIKHVEGDTP